MLLIVLMVGAIIGGLTAELLSRIEALAGIVPYLYIGYSVVSISPITVDLFVIKLTFAGSFSPNIMSIIGVVLAFILYRRY